MGLEDRTCGNCKGTGNVYEGFGGTAPGGAGGTVTCNVCNGTGMVGGAGPTGQGGSKLPFLVFLVAAVVGVATGYLAYENSSFGGGYDRTVTAILVGVFGFLAVGILYRAATNPLRTIVILAILWALDHFALGGQLSALVRGLLPA
jgi:hypothetical protein